MKLYYHPASTTCRPVMLLLAETGIACDLELVDMYTGAHHQPPYLAINPNGLVPLLEDGDFRLSESAAILKYISDKSGTGYFSADLKARARINERLDWFNTQFARDIVYGYVYPQLLPHHHRGAIQQATLDWGLARVARWLPVLNDHLLADGPYLCGAQMSIADLQGAVFMHVALSTGGSLAPYPRVEAWMARLKALPSWAGVHQAFDGWIASLDRSTLQGF